MQKSFIILAAAMLSGCALSMTPAQFAEQLPMVTKSEYYEQIDANQAISDGYCKVLIVDRVYNAPIGLTVYDDVRNGAKGVDEWVDLDGGNAYKLNNFQWETVDAFGSTRLIIEFDTMLCSK